MPASNLQSTLETIPRPNRTWISRLHDLHGFMANHQHSKGIELVNYLCNAFPNNTHLLLSKANLQVKYYE